MKAVRILGYGQLADNVVVREVEAPRAGSGEVAIAIEAAGINPIDAKIIGGELRRVEPLKFPSPLGFDCSGVVSDVGAGVTAFKPGDAVFARASRDRLGTFAERIALPAAIVGHKPATLSHVEAASLPLVGLTAVQALSEYAKARPGEHVLIHAGAGGFGTFAIQYAKALGLRVTTTARDRDALALKGLGADDVVRYDVESYLDRATLYDVVLDTLGGAYTVDAFRVLKPSGAVVSIAGPPDRDFARREGLGTVAAIAIWFMSRRVYQAAKAKQARFFRFLTRSDGAQLEQIRALVDEGKLRPVIDRTYPFAEVVTALQYVAEGHSKGKVILTMT
jgi:alcohol dehydrogenase